MMETKMRGDSLKASEVDTEAHIKQHLKDISMEPIQDKFLQEKMPDQKLQGLNVSATLEQRGSRYGKFSGHAEVTQGLKKFIGEELAKRNKTLPDNQMEALDMICHKIGRIINGDNNYDDSWIDIAGYSKLVADKLNGIDV